MSKNNRDRFFIPQIEEEKKKDERKPSKFVSPYKGTQAKDEHVYPYVKYDNDGRQYKGFKGGNDDDLNVIFTNRESIEESKKKKEEEKYSPNRIPSYYRKEENLGINRYNLPDLRGDKLSEEEVIEKNRRQYGSNYQEIMKKESEKVEEKKVNPVEQKPIQHEQNSNPYGQNRIQDPMDGYDFTEVIVDTPKKPEYSNQMDSSVNDINPSRNIDFFHVDSNKDISDSVIDDFGNVNKPVEKIVSETPRRDRSIQPEDNSSSKKGLMFGNTKMKYTIPPMELLKKNGRKSGINCDQVNYQISVINRTLEEFKVGGKVITYTKGPTVTQFEVKLEPGVNVNKVTGLQKNLQMSLESESIRIQAPIPGKSTVGIEAPNVTRDTVLFGDMINNEKFLKDGKPLNVILGISISGEPIYVNIGDMPHCLVAGATGGGKTVCLYSMIASLLYKVSPEEVKMILIDPKRNELIYFEDIPHLATPIIDDPKLATASLKWAVEEMDRRYDFLKANRKRTIDDYNSFARANGLKIIPFIVIVIDEFADLMNTASETFETNVQRLTQKARSAGIHLIIATQRPSTDVIRGTIKANIPTRIAFSVQTTVDSMTILDHVGAEKLLRKGDMLYTRGNNDIRVQGSYISETELDSLSSFYYEQNITPNFMFTHDEIRNKAEVDTNSGTGGNPMDDELFDDIARFVFRQQKASANQIQNTYEIGFNRANKIITGLAEIGIVTSENIPGKAREVIIKDIELLEDILRNR